jgi:hypothetical protein
MRSRHPTLGPDEDLYRFRRFGGALLIAAGDFFTAGSTARCYGVAIRAYGTYGSISADSVPQLID